jgi:RNA polymerase sigma-70 factor, ECF subfamily
MGSFTDAELLSRVRRGDEQAFDALFERYEKPLFLFLLGIVRDYHRAEDALQETFVQALERLEGIDPGHLRGWLFTVAYHQGMLTRRKLASQQRHFPRAAEDPDQVADAGAALIPRPQDDPALLAESHEEAQRCGELLRQLPESQQEVIRLRLYEGKRFRDIAADLGCPLNTALARMHQGLKKLRSLGGQHGDA